MAMKSYHFDIGDSNEGPIGMAGRVMAESREAAVARLRGLLGKHVVGDVVVTDGVTVFDGQKGNSLGLHPEEYLTVYLNPDAITVEDIGEENEVGEGDEAVHD